MKEPKITADGSCPTCSGDNWKLAKMIVLDGVSHVDLTSSGGGYGVGAGLGRGHGGVGVNYQSVDLTTSGLNTSASALEYAPPVVPPLYSKKQYYFDQCAETLIRAAVKVKEFDEFSTTTKSIHPGGPNAGHSSVSRAQSYYQSCCNELQIFQYYERKKAVWEKTRVCLRCGDCFISEQDMQSSQISFALPEFKFEGQHRCCPQCKDYMWKTAETFFTIKLRELQKKLESDLERQQESVEYANNPNEGGFWKRLGRKLLALSLEDANEKVLQAQHKLASIIKDRELAIEMYSDFEKLRVCSVCETLFSLDNGGSKGY